ncbi:hypothetical protein B9Z55_003467 [Caenorhabditis nigoni]|uniref:Uncharacterized protein n=1 Tax=Caenorhabditis nigoni TaxID=1611254 RepID=A0A2G5VQE1_9PELO|nr:hypothetical protein B9Z55_003467 [Caenorhabditis nigoni]
MSDSSQSVQKSFEKSMKFGEKEPKEEVFSDDEPARKRSKNMANPEDSQDTSEISELRKKLKVSENVIEEMGLWVKKLEKLHDEDIDSLKKSINDLAGNLEKKFAEKAEEDREKMKKEFAEKINKIEKVYQEKIDNLSQENSKIKKDCQEKIDKMGDLDSWKKSIEKSIIMSDDAKIPPTKSELEFLFKCIFCKSENHKSIDCRVVADHLGRKNCLRTQNRCIKCLEPETPENPEKSSHMCPRALVACSNCVIYPDVIYLSYLHLHHPIICSYNDQSPYREARRQASNRDRIKSGRKPRFS